MSEVEACKGWEFLSRLCFTQCIVLALSGIATVQLDRRYGLRILWLFHNHSLYTIRPLHYQLAGRGCSPAIDVNLILPSFKTLYLEWLIHFRYDSVEPGLIHNPNTPFAPLALNLLSRVHLRCTSFNAFYLV